MIDLDFFSSPIGLGHATRDAAIATHLDGISTKFVTGSHAAQFLNKLGFVTEDTYKPPQFVVKDGSLQHSARWLLNYYRYYTRCKDISNKIISQDKPKLVVSDEDFASLAVAQKRGIPTILITDILETHFTRRPASFFEKRMNKAMTDIIRKCDVVLVPEYGDNHTNIRKIGPIVRHIDTPREILREAFSFTKKTILVSVGGTSAGAFLIDKILEIAPNILPDTEIILVSGPALKMNSHGILRDFGFVDNLHELIFAADILVSLAGKSTIDEANAYGTPGIFIPIRGHFEQEDNAKAEGFEFGDIDHLEHLISEKLKQKRGPLTNGSSVEAAKIIHALQSNP